MIIKTKKFILRPLQKGDETSLQRNINNKKIYRVTLRVPYPYTLKHARNWIAKNIKERKKGKKAMVTFAIDINGEMVGGIGLSHIEFPRAEMGYWLKEELWNKGIMTEVVGLATDFAFKELKVKRVYAGVFPFNKASMRVLEKNGYKLEGVLGKNLRKDNKILDEYLFAKVK